MRKRNLPQPFQIDKVRFADCFTAPSLRHFGVLITGWVLTVGVHTISQVILTSGLHESESFVSVYRFLQKAKWAPDQVAFQVFRSIVDTLAPGVTEIELVLDDTLNDHVGKKIFGAGFQHDGDAPKTGRPIGYGVCFVIIGVVVRLPGISDRVFCLPYAARLWWPQKAKVKPRGEKHRSKSELGAELIQLTRSWLDPSITLRVIVDGGYSNKQLLQGRPQGVHITGKVRMDAALYAVAPQDPPGKRGRPRKKGDRLPCPRSTFAREKDGWEWIWITLYGQETIVEAYRFEAIWYKAAGNEPLSVVMVRDPGGKYPDTVFFDTDIAAADSETIGRFSHRWSIEITNRETKSLLGSADPQCRSEKSVSRSPLMAYWSYCLVVVWFVDQFRMGKDLMIRTAPWYSKRHITFSDMLAAARRSHFIPGISRDPGEHRNDTKFGPPRSTRGPEWYERAKL
ncbi:MAG: transposase, partial [Patescibacteria group bacterium]